MLASETDGTPIIDEDASRLLQIVNLLFEEQLQRL